MKPIAIGGRLEEQSPVVAGIEILAEQPALARSGRGESLYYPGRKA